MIIKNHPRGKAEVLGREQV